MLHKPYVRIVLVYLIIASAWIFLSDSVLYSFGIDDRLLPNLSIFKGLAFIVLTASILYLHLRHIFEKQYQLEASLSAQMQHLSRAQASLSQSEARLRKAVEEAPVPTAIFADDGAILTMSRAWLEITGYTADQLKTVDAWTELAYGADKQRVQTVIADLFERDARVDEGEFTVTCRDGSQRIWAFSSTPLGTLGDTRRAVISIASDVTEDKKRQAKLASELEHNQRILTSMFDGFLLTDLAGRILDVNARYCEMLGYTRDELCQMTIFDLETSVPRHQVTTNARQIMHNEGAMIVEAQHRHQDGSMVDLEISSVRIEPDRIACFIRDITARKCLETQLRETNDMLQMIFDHIPVMIALFDTNGQFEVVNQFWIDRLGWTAEELRTIPDPLLLFYPDAAYRQSAVEYMSAAKPGWREFRTHTKHGTTLEASWANVHLADGRSIGIGQDVTERVRMEAALRESEQRFRQLAEHIHEVFYLTDSDKRQLLYVSPAFESIWGRSRESLYADDGTFIESIHPDDRADVQANLQRQRAGQPVDFSYRIIRPDGAVRWIRSRAFPVYDEAGRLYRSAGIAEDVTETVQFENQLRRLAQRLVSVMDDERSRIARELHDQIGQQLTGLGINLGIIEMQVGRDHPALPILADSTELVSTIIERIRLIIADLRPLILDDMGLVAGLRWYAQRFTRRTGIPVTLDASPTFTTINPTVDNTLYCVAQEALTNTAKHAGASHVWISLHASDDQLTMTIRDDGRGFDAAGVLASNPNGSWGLQIMQERTQPLVGAQLIISSQPGGGTQIRVEVPL